MFLGCIIQQVSTIVEVPLGHKLGVCDWPQEIVQNMLSMPRYMSDPRH
jgi:hypothetical protein